MVEYDNKRQREKASQ